MTALDNQMLVETISSLVLSNDSSSIPPAPQFPLRIKVDLANSEANESPQLLKLYLSEEGIRWSTTDLVLSFSTSERAPSNSIVTHLCDNNWSITFDYGQFVSHPGMLFVKGLERSPSLLEDLTDHFKKQCRYKLLADVNVIGVPPEDSNGSNANATGHCPNEVAAIIKYDNFLDAEYALVHANGANSFGPKMQVNRYISKKERALANEQSPNLRSNSSVNPHEDSVVYDTIVVENFNDFIAGTLSIEQFQTILEKFELFLPIECIFFPTANGESDRLRFKKVGYIRIELDKEMNLKLLKALYYLNGLTLKQLLEFSKDDIYDLTLDLNIPERERTLKSAKLKLSIAQRKHNHHLYENSDSLYVGLTDDNKVQVFEANEKLVESGFIDQFSKSSNYQETNVYVNNFPIIFENDDTLWAEFWNQFGIGRVKSAKIIKPYFYSKKSDGALGKIGFVFYEEFKMALRAIILTNNKSIKYKNCPSILIQASFAIQKHSSYSQPPSKQSHSKFTHPAPPMNYYPLHEPSKQYNGGSPFVPFPEQYVFHPYMMSMPHYTPGLLPEDNPEEGVGEFRRLLEDFTGATHGGATFPPHFGFYYPYFPYSGLMPMGAPIPPHMPTNGLPIPVQNQNNQRSERKKSG
ncbi:CIC11C00000000916 [Sungouiella intermedia]|uniref:CIC11C00000000916 n=1 Tax=Sungouiella intermedia TaxID=45354 RepID=A0A1L0CX62_9ASCO|nr:CIC11C00000000916 [[Candida] intermedia]